MDDRGKTVRLVLVAVDARIRPTGFSYAFVVSPRRLLVTQDDGYKGVCIATNLQ
jgi:hypothetical protein